MNNRQRHPLPFHVAQQPCTKRNSQHAHDPMTMTIPQAGTSTGGGQEEAGRQAGSAGDTLYFRRASDLLLTTEKNVLKARPIRPPPPPPPPSPNQEPLSVPVNYPPIEEGPPQTKRAFREGPPNKAGPPPPFQSLPIPRDRRPMSMLRPPPSRPASPPPLPHLRPLHHRLAHCCRPTTAQPAALRCPPPPIAFVPATAKTKPPRLLLSPRRRPSAVCYARPARKRQRPERPDNRDMGESFLLALLPPMLLYVMRPARSGTKYRYTYTWYIYILVFSTAAIVTVLWLLLVEPRK